MRSKMRKRMLVASGVCIALFGLAGQAAAQVPPVPGVPGLPPGVPGIPSLPGTPGVPPGVPGVPPEVAEVIGDAQDALVPIMIDGATQAEPVANAAGFALRGPCSAIGTVMVLAVIAGGATPLPVSPGFAMTPVFLFCGAAYEPGPADPVFGQVDDAAGDQFEEAAEPGLDQVSDAVTPVRPELAEVCAVLALAGSTPRQVPPPLHRLDVTGALCSG